MRCFAKSVDVKHKIAVIGIALALASACGTQPQDYPITPVPFTEVEITDSFWLPRLETNRTVTIPYALQMSEETGRIANFAVAAGLEEGRPEGYYFNDSDVYKIIEGASYSLHLFPDPELESAVDAIIAKIAAAQEEDGYLYTARTAMTPDRMPPGGKERWSNIAHGHELYNVGHLYEGAVAYYLATGKRALLDVALKNAELILRVFGPEKKRYPPGHQEIEIGLGKLYRLTGEQKYLDLAKFFLDQRGDPEGHELYGEYSQDHASVLEQEEAVGHAVRAAYMYTGMADVAALTGDHSYIQAIDRIWENVVGKKLYLTGGIGAAGGHEGFGPNYDLPNRVAYSETCASIANALWNHRMFLMHGQARYMDVLERVVYNAFLSGVSLEGNRFFYPNRLETFQGEERSPWFACACCPSNIVRFVPSIPGYIYAYQGDRLYVNLFIGSRARIPLSGQIISLRQETRYPWEGEVNIVVEPEKNRDWTLSVRIPGWARNEPLPSDLYRYRSSLDTEVVLEVNGEPVAYEISEGYAHLHRRWRSGDTVRLTLPMEIRRVEAHRAVAADVGKVALERGPLVYAVEWPDTESGKVRNLLLPDEAVLTTEFSAEQLHGMQIIRGRAKALHLTADGSGVEEKVEEFTAIPYYAWAHRGKGEMSVWLASAESAARPLPPPTIASRSKVTASGGRNPGAVNDQLDPENSIDHSVPYFHWWPQKGTTEWIQLDFPERRRVSRVEVYWFDDTGMGGCRVPESWRVLYREGTNWKPVRTGGGYGVDRDTFNRVSFRAVETRALRLEIKLQDNFATGIHEWRVR
jgi:DUF1680 family protein